MLLQLLKSRLALSFGTGLIMGLVLMVFMKRLSRHSISTDPTIEAKSDNIKLQIIRLACHLK